MTIEITMKTRMAWGILGLALTAGMSLGGCAADPVDECRSDSDCKGDRVCDGGDCVAPAPSTTDEGEGEGEGPGCGDGVCDPGETSACSDCPSADPFATLLVNNVTSFTVSRLFVAACSGSSWGPEQLGGKIIAGGDVFTLTQITPDCYRFRAETKLGETFWEGQPTDLPAGETYTWTLLP